MLVIRAVRVDSWIANLSLFSVSRELRARVLLLQAALIACSLAVVSLARLDVIAGDPLVYFARMEQIRSDGLPYFQVPYEHFPLMLMPMSLTWLIGGSTSAQAFRVVWTVLTSLALLLVTWSVSSMDDSGRAELTYRWIVVTAPLLPLIVFRTEPWVILPVVWFVRSLYAGRPGPAISFSLLGTVAKGWPAILGLGLWAQGLKRLAFGGLLSSALLLGLMVKLPGFMAARSFDGLHAESTGGTIWMVLGSITGREVDLVSSAGAIYVDAPPYLLIPGVVVGSVLAVLAMSRLRLARNDPIAVLGGLGGIVAAFLLLAPLQSSQFVLWLLPFVVLGSRTRSLDLLAIALGLAATLSTAYFGLLEDLNPGWIALVALRHGLIAVIGWRLVRGLQPSRRGDESRETRSSARADTLPTVQGM